MRSNTVFLMAFAAFILLVPLLMLMKDYEDERPRVDIMNHDGTLGPGEVFFDPITYSDEEEGILEEGWVIKGKVFALGTEIMVVVGRVEELEAAELQLRKDGVIDYRLPTIQKFYIHNETMNISVPVEEEGRYSIILYNTHRCEWTEENCVSENITQYHIDIYAENPKYYWYNDVGRPIFAAVSTLLTGLLSTFLFYFLLLERRERGEGKLSKESLKRTFVVMGGLLAAIAFSLFYGGGLCILYPFLFAALLFTVITGPAMIKREEEKGTPGRMISVFGHIEKVEEDRVRMMVLVRNLTSDVLKDIVIYPELPPDHHMFGIGEQYIIWLDPGDDGKVYFTFKRTRKTPKIVPISFRVEYHYKGRVYEERSEKYWLNFE
ncbi:MAG: hypothetical protein J7L88_00115 [Thermoplasmata archaeon]|nr:hypothetical protein [Thermoplasmata archaeon]